MTKYYILYRYCLVQVNALQYGQIHLRNHALYLQPHTSNATPIFFPSPHSIIMPFYPHFFPFLSPFLTPTYPPPFSTLSLSPPLHSLALTSSLSPPHPIPLPSLDPSPLSPLILSPPPNTQPSGGGPSPRRHNPKASETEQESKHPGKIYPIYFPI